MCCQEREELSEREIDYRSLKQTQGGHWIKLYQREMQKDSGTKNCYIIEEANSGAMGKVYILLSNHHYLYFPWKGVVRGLAGHGDMVLKWDTQQ